MTFHSEDQGRLDLEPADLTRVDKYTFYYNSAYVKFKPEIVAEDFYISSQGVKNTALTIVLKAAGDAPIQWNQLKASQSLFLPTVYRVQSGNALLMYRYITSKYIRKQNTCTAGKVKFLKINADLNRIEYGVISAQNQMVIHKLDIEDQGYLLSTIHSDSGIFFSS